jgi:hypothetical protein
MCYYMVTKMMTNLWETLNMCSWNLSKSVGVTDRQCAHKWVITLCTCLVMLTRRTDWSARRKIVVDLLPERLWPLETGLHTLVEICQSFEWTILLPSSISTNTLHMEAINFSEISVHFYQTKLHKIPENSNLHSFRHENLKYCIMNRWIHKSPRIHWHAPPKCCQDLTESFQLLDSCVLEKECDRYLILHKVVTILPRKDVGSIDIPFDVII